MPLLILMTLLLFISWLFSEVFLLGPISFLDSLNPLSNLTLIVVVLGILWCFGD
ncbi:MAG: hypothetical protein WA828_04590 [Coleofasciculaceae cyanobacterium]